MGWGDEVELGNLLRRCQSLLVHVLGLCQRCGLVGLCVLPSIMVWSPFLLCSDLHDGFFGFIFPVERVLLVRSQGSCRGKKDV